MKNFLLSKKQSVTVAVSGLVSVLMVAGIVYSATTISTNVNTGGTLSVTGASTLTGAITTGSTLGVSTSTPFTLASNSLAVQGNDYISGALVNVSNITATGTLSVTGAATLSSTLSVTGLSTLTGYISTASSSVAANLNIAGPLSASSTLTVAGASSLNGNTNINGNATTTASSGQFATQGFVGAGGTSTPRAEFSATGSGTTTAYLDTSGTLKGSCIELVSSTSTVWRMYIGASDAATATPNTGRSGGTSMLAIWELGSCK